MSTIFNIRNLKLPSVSRAAVVVGAVVVVLAIVAAVVGWKVYKKLTNNTVVAYFQQALALVSRATRCRSWASRSARSTASSPPATR